MGIFRGILGVITIFSIIVTLSKMGKPLPMRTSVILISLAFFLLVLCPKVIAKFFRFIAFGVTIYAILAYLGGINTLTALLPLLIMFIGFYIMIRPLMHRKNGN